MNDNEVLTFIGLAGFEVGAIVYVLSVMSDRTVGARLTAITVISVVIVGIGYALGIGR